MASEDGLELNDSNFDDVVPRLPSRFWVDFWAPWCAASRTWVCSPEPCGCEPGPYDGAAAFRGRGGASTTCAAKGPHQPLRLRVGVPAAQSRLPPCRRDQADSRKPDLRRGRCRQPLGTAVPGRSGSSVNRGLLAARRGARPGRTSRARPARLWQPAGLGGNLGRRRWGARRTHLKFPSGLQAYVRRERPANAAGRGPADRWVVLGEPARRQRLPAGPGRPRRRPWTTSPAQQKLRLARKRCGPSTARRRSRTIAPSPSCCLERR